MAQGLAAMKPSGLLQHAALLDGGLDHAAQRGLRSQERGTDASFVKVISGGKTGDPAADDQDFVTHCNTYILNSRTKSTTARTLSGGVSGRIPWPRLKIWPGREPVRFSSSWTRIFQLGKRREQHGRIQVALDRGAIADVHPGLVDVDAPIDPHHVAAGGVQFAEKSSRAGAEVNHRNAGGADALDQRAGIRRDIADIIVGAERAHPAIEHLDGARAGGHLAEREGSQHVHQLAHQAAPQRLVLIHHGLGPDEIL